MHLELSIKTIGAYIDLSLRNAKIEIKGIDLIISNGIKGSATVLFVK